MTRDEIIAKQERSKRFLKTPLGDAFNKFVKAHYRYCHAYGMADADPRANYNALYKLYEELRGKRDVLLSLLHEAALEKGKSQ